MNDNQAMDAALRRALTDGCTLDPAELDERLGEIERLTRWALTDRQDFAGGIALTFDRAAATEVRDLVRRERECCGHVEFAVDETDEVIRVEIVSRPASDGGCGSPMCRDGSKPYPASA
jgi:hypothetical protein